MACCVFLLKKSTEKAICIVLFFCKEFFSCIFAFCVITVDKLSF